MDEKVIESESERGKEGLASAGWGCGRVGEKSPQHGVSTQCGNGDSVRGLDSLEAKVH